MRRADVIFGLLLAALVVASMNLDHWLTAIDSALTPEPPALEGRTFGAVQCWRINGGEWQCGCTLRGKEAGALAETGKHDEERE